MCPTAQPDEERVKPPEPGEFQQLVFGYLEDECGDAEPQELRYDQHDNGAEPIALGEEPEFQDLERQQREKWNDEDDERRRGRQTIDEAHQGRLDETPWNDADDAGDDWCKPIP